MRRIALTLTATFIILTGGPVSAATTTQTPPKGLIKATDKGYVELVRQMRDPRTPPIEYWVYGVAKCETSGDWDGSKGAGAGHFAGGLGISQTTWYNYGGFEFANRVEKATVTAQLVVANRIAIFGYQWKNRYRTWADKQAGKGMYKWPHYVWGWGCSREVVGDPCGRLKDKTRGSWKPSKYPASWKYYKANC